MDPKELVDLVCEGDPKAVEEYLKHADPEDVNHGILKYIRSIRSRLFNAFEAGFDLSGEGHNAEYMHSRYTNENYEPYMRRKFQEWLDYGH